MEDRRAIIDLDGMQRQYFQIAITRANHGDYDIEDGLKHAAGECIEASNAELVYRHSKYVHAPELKKDKEDFTLELADIVLCVMTTASVNGIKFSDILKKGFEKEKQRTYLIDREDTRLASQKKD